MSMRITISIPDNLAKKFQETIPPRKRSNLVARLLRNELKKREILLEAACLKANNDHDLNKEIDKWQSFDDEIHE